MKGKWMFLAAVTVLVFGAASAIWIRQDVSSSAARDFLPDEQSPAPDEAVNPVEAEAVPLENETDRIGMASSASSGVPPLQTSKMETQETTSRKPGEPVNPPPVPTQFPEPPVPQMGWAEARYEIDGRTVAPGNQHGQIALVHVKPGARISATMKWPKAVPGATVALEVVDGGRLEDGQLSALTRVNERGEIAFRFTANRQSGTCQVVARSGMDETVLCFWVANESAKNIPAGL